MKFTKADLPNIYKNYPKEFEKFNEILSSKSKNKQNQSEYFAYLKSFDDNLVNNPKVLKPFISNLVELDFSSKDLQKIWTFANSINELYGVNEEKIKKFIYNDEFLDNNYGEYLQNNDYYKFSDFDELLNESLRKDGIDSQFIYLVEPYLKINVDPDLDYVQINVYANNLTKISEEYILKEFVEEKYEIEEYLKSFEAPKFKLENVNKM